MRVAAFILSLLGSIAMFTLGALWTDDADHLKEAEDAMAAYQKTVKELGQATGKTVEDNPTRRELESRLELVRQHARAAYPMVGCGLVAFIAAFFVFKFPRPAGVILLLAAIIPAALNLTSLVVGFLLVIAGLLALLARPKRTMAPSVTPAAT